MSQRILLADNSYTIRRIVELSFQDMENVELFSFENGANLKEKLLEIVPQIVLIDIKLPDFNGYEACRFINNEPSLNNTKILLMKGGFEPIDEDLLSDLNYEDIITKPFDSKLLENQVINLLKESDDVVPPPLSIPEELNIPSIPQEEIKDEEISIDSEINIGSDTFPESLPEFGEEDAMQDNNDGISFSDVKEELVEQSEEKPDINSASEILNETPTFEDDKIDFNNEIEDISGEGLLSEDVMDENKIVNNGAVFDEPEPSEEITQGSFEEPNDDNLAVGDEEENILNPFKESGVAETDEHDLKEHIKAHEEELGMDSLTVEEMRIKSDIENRNKGLDSDNDEFGTDSFGGLENKPSFDNISFEEDNKDSQVEDELREEKLSETEAEQKPNEEIDKSIFEVAEDILNDDVDMSHDNKEEDDSERPEGLFDKDNKESMFNESEEKEEKQEDVEQIEANVSQTDFSFGEMENSNIESETLEPKIEEQVDIPPELSETETALEQVEAKTEVDSEETILEQNISFGEVQSQNLEENILDANANEQVDLLQEKSETFTEPEKEDAGSQQNISFSDNSFDESNQQVSEPMSSDTPTLEHEILSEEKHAEPEQTEENNLIPNEEKIPAVKEETLNEDIDMKKIMNRVEEKLTVAVKEILWEIIPPLAEKIIKKEVEDLEKEIEEK